MIALLLAASTFCNPMSISNATVEIISRDHPKGWRALDLEGGPAAAVDGRYRTWWTAESPACRFGSRKHLLEDPAVDLDGKALRSRRPDVGCYFSDPLGLLLFCR